MENDWNKEKQKYELKLEDGRIIESDSPMGVIDPEDFLEELSRQRRNK